MQTSLVTPHVFAALVVIVAANAGLNTALGAHPFWSVQVAWIGVPLGIILAIISRALDLRWSRRVALFSLALAASGALAAFGKARFAASYGEDALAGHLWYAGWIATIAFATAAISAFVSPTRLRATD